MSTFQRLDQQRASLIAEKATGNWSIIKEAQLTNAINGLHELALIDDRARTSQLAGRDRKELNQKLKRMRKIQKERNSASYVLDNYKQHIEKNEHRLPKLLRARRTLLDDQIAGGDRWNVAKYRRLLGVLDELEDFRRALDYINRHESPYAEEKRETNRSDAAALITTET